MWWLWHNTSTTTLAEESSTGIKVCCFVFTTTILSCVWHRIKANATSGSVTVHFSWEEGVQEWKPILSINSISWLVSNAVRKLEISLEAVNCSKLRIRRNAFTSCWSMGSINSWGTIFPFPPLCYLRSPLLLFSLGQILASLLSFLPYPMQTLGVAETQNHEEIGLTF